MKSAPGRLLLRIAAVLAVAASSFAVSAAPAHAAGVANNVRWGESSTVQTIEEIATCWEGVRIPYRMRVQWNYYTENSSLYVYSVSFSFYNNSSSGLTRGNAGIDSASPFQRLYPANENVGAWLAAPTRTIYPYRSLTWRGNKFITFYVSVSRPCGGYIESAFQLVKAYN